MEKKAILTVDLGFGDAGKGSIVDGLVRHFGAHTVVRYNGGPQAAHRVVTADGREHIFAQFGSGTFTPGVSTYLSAFMLLHPLAMINEERHLRALGVTDAFERLAIDRNAVVICPFEQAASRLKELARGENRVGTCGLGVSEAVQDRKDFKDQVIFAADLGNPETVYTKLVFLKRAKLEQLQEFLSDVPDSPLAKRELLVFCDPEVPVTFTRTLAELAGKVRITDETYWFDLMKKPGTVVFEAGQGALLDQTRGFVPFVTRSNTTLDNARTLLTQANFDGQIRALGLCRSYATRHGPGPFVPYDTTFTSRLPDLDNVDNPWQGQFRVGPFDLVATKYALKIANGVDGLAVSCLDRMTELPDARICVAYEYPGDPADLDENFVHQGSRIAEIRDGGSFKVTETLSRCQPVFRNFPDGRSDTESWLHYLEKELNTKIAIKSFGPMAKDKQYFTNFWGG